jgi:hypothetical protein
MIMSDGNRASIGDRTFTAGPIHEVRRCEACKILFRRGDLMVLIPIGPGDDSEARVACAQGRPYNAVSIMAHYACVTGRRSPSE